MGLSVSARKPDPILTICIMAFLLSLVGLLWVPLARSAPPSGTDPSGEMATWYRSLIEPGTGVGCCSVSDCRPLNDADWRQTAKGYEVHWRDQWIAVPPDRILDHKPNPTGEPVACVYGEPAEVHCFVRPAET